ncbi:MAG: LysM peptidoglycan-binding domain-containing protein [Chloroflexi bacterium]|nr:LysM peptidoglycan-binding domain-containing protein [Chloroflexota bacterium]
MIQKRTLIGILLAAVLLGTVPALGIAAPSPSQLVQEGTELLKNPGFEGITCAPGSEPGWCLDNWSNTANFDGSFHDNIFTPQGWISWWRTGGDYGQPEVKTIPNVAPFTGELPRIRSGNYAVLFFTFYRLQDTGLYQVVTGLEPGSTVRLSAYAHGWSCDGDDPMGYTCADPWNQTFQVGIEPNGGTDPFSPAVIWSGEQRSPDHYNFIGPTSAQVGEGGSVTVFLRSKTKWAYKYQDAYWDDASLVMTSPGTPPTDTPPPPPPPPTAGPSPTPRSAPTPRPDGAIVHIVESGDTLFGIALMYDVETDKLRELNAGSLGPNDLINVGQALVISIPSATPIPTPLPAPPTAEVTPVPGSPGGASICVLAYHDRNGDTFRDEATEELLPNAEFTIANAAGVVDRYTSNGVNEPHCFTGLTPGAYRVIQTAPTGYAPSGPAEYSVGLPEETSLDFQFGDVRSESPENTGEATDPTPEGEEPEPGGGTTVSRIFSTVAKVSGILVLLLAVGVAVLYFLNRRRMI